jgi:hypothetical protein
MWLQSIDVKKLISKYALVHLILVAEILLVGCKSDVSESSAAGIERHPLSSFSQEIKSPVREFSVKAGAVYVIDINVKNTGTEPWVG